MDVSVSAAAAIGKHRNLLRSGRDGRVLSALMPPFFRLSTPAGFGVLTTTGRKTGVSTSKCVRAIRRGGQVDPQRYHAFLGEGMVRWRSACWADPPGNAATPRPGTPASPE
jgi:hypothetical protein